MLQSPFLRGLPRVAPEKPAPAVEPRGGSVALVELLVLVNDAPVERTDGGRIALAHVFGIAGEVGHERQVGEERNPRGAWIGNRSQFRVPNQAPTTTP